MDVSESSADERWWRRWPPLDPAVSGDAVAGVAFVAVAVGSLSVPVTTSAAARAVVGLPLLFFVPGYALVASLFPGRRTPGDSSLDWHGLGRVGGPLVDRGFEWRERVALSFAASLAILPLLAVALSLLDAPYSLEVVLSSLAGIGVLGMLVAVVRRSALPADRRFRLPYRRWVETTDRALFHQDRRLDAVLNAALALVVLVSVAGVGFAVVTPNNGEAFTSVTLLSSGDGGDLVAGDYPGAINESGERFVLRVANDERRSVAYGVVAELQRVRSSDDGVDVVRSREVLRTSRSVAAGENWTHAHTVGPALTGEDLRLVYYVYAGEAPADPSAATATEHVYVWVDVPAN